MLIKLGTSLHNDVVTCDNNLILADIF